MSRKHFVHRFYHFDDLKSEIRESGRVYTLPSGKVVDSVTTILGRQEDKQKVLAEWKKRVGEEEAQKVSTQASNRGTALHSLCEKYLLNEPSYTRGAMPTNVDSFKQLKPILDERVGKIFAIEAPLYSETLNTAGRSDCIAEFDGIPTIIDFKTSRKIKKEEWIENYFLQATCYSLMVEELTNLKVPQIAILITVDHEKPQVFVKDRNLYVDKVREIFK